MVRVTHTRPMTMDEIEIGFAREPGARLMDASEDMDRLASAFDDAQRVLDGLDAPERRILEDAYRRMGRFGGGLTPGQAALLCRAGVGAIRRAAGRDAS